MDKEQDGGLRDLAKPIVPANARLRGQKGELNDVLAQRDVVDLLLFLAWDYADVFEEATRDCVRLASSKELCLLVDFDVLRNHIEKGTTDKVDTLAVDYLFMRSHMRFAIPLGAFVELEDYIHQAVPFARRISVRGDKLDRREVTEQLASMLSVENPPELSDSDLAEELLFRLEKTALLLTRLLALLTNPRFVGVVARYDLEHYQKLLPLVRQAERPRRKGPRTIVDDRDAINLAIACGTAGAGTDSEASGRGVPGHSVLISQTGAVINLAQHAHDTHDTRDIGVLSELMGVEKAAVHHLFPVMHPRRLVIAELLGVTEDPGRAIERARSLRRDFRDLGDHLEGQQEVMRSGDRRALYEKALGPFLEEEMRLVQDILQGLRRKLLPLHGSELGRIESLRATSLSVERAHRLQAGKKADGQTELREKSASFSRLVDDVLSAMETAPGVAYNLQAAPCGLGPFQTIKILELLDGLEPFAIASGEILLPTDQPEGGPRSYYVLRWPITCSENQLFEALTRCIAYGPEPCPGAAPGHSDIAQPFGPVDPNSPLWQEGIIISTPDCDYGLPADALSHNHGWHTLRLDRLGPLLQDALRVDVESGARTPIVLEIEQIRINTTFGDFVYDVVPIQEQGVRHFSVLSHLDLSETILTFYECLGTLCPARTKLLPILEQAFGGFPPPEHSQDQQLEASTWCFRLQTEPTIAI